MAIPVPSPVLHTTRAKVVAEALRWLGTPYHHHGRLHGVGVDCAMLLAEVYERCGLVAHVDAGLYPREWHLHRSQELFLGWLWRCGATEVQVPRAGDVAIYRFGRCFSHGAVLVDDAGTAVHAYIGLGVIRTAPDEAPLAGRPRRCFTLFTAGPEATAN